jgi:hypothetical protein
MEGFVDTIQDFDVFKAHNSKKDIICTIVGVDEQLHSILNKVCCLVISNFHYEHYIIPIEHNESIKEIPFEFILNNFLKNHDGRIFVLDKKQFYHYTKISNCFDIHLILSEQNKEIQDFDTPCQNFVYNNFWNFKNQNYLIPLSKHLEKFSKLHSEFIPLLLNYKINEGYEKTNDYIIELAKVEENGLEIDVDKFTQYFKIKKKHFLNNRVYTEYNCYTSTGRPSNKHGGVNYAALNKDNGERSCFISRFKNGKLVYFDFIAFHPHLIATLIDYDFHNENVYEYFSKYLKCSIDESKSKVFEQLYGGIKEEYKHIPFLQETSKYIESLWDYFYDNQHIKTPVFERIININSEESYPNKVFNYLLQAYETEIGFQVLREIHTLLKDKNSKVVLYLYDGILIDFDVSDGKDILRTIKTTVECGGKFPVSIKYGSSFNNLIKL